MKYLFSVFSLLLGANAFGQDNFQISGSITDATNGETLIGVNVVDTLSGKGSSTNTYGFYSLNIPEGRVVLEFSYIGYEPQYRSLIIKENQNLNISLSESSTTLMEVQVSSTREDEQLRNTEIGAIELDVKQIDKVPVLFGEKDILKTLQLLPGISTISEGSSNFSVRGGSYDQNLIQLDEATVYSPSHLLGFFSTFNSDALKNVKVYKGGIPAQYGGRGSSVLDVQMKEGNNQEYEGKASIGLISSKLQLEGPIEKGESSFLISGRRTYADLIADATGFVDDGTTLYFYDLNGKINFKLGEKDRLLISGYLGRDEFGLNDIGTDWENQTATIRWNHIVNNRLFSNTTLNYSNYDFGFALGSNGSYRSGVEDWAFKQDMTYYLSDQHELKFGLSSIYHSFAPGSLDLSDEDAQDRILQETQALESGIYISDVYKVNDKLSLDFGIRWSIFNQLGAGTVYSYNSANDIIDSASYGSGEIIKTYNNLEPRFALNYSLNSTSSIKAGYNRMAQYLHLLSNSTSGQPTDTWVPSTNNIAPSLIDQYSIGYFRHFKEHSYKSSVELYYKDMHNITDYEDGTNLLLNENIEAQILSGQGRSYGAEFLIEKTKGDLTGWISYTLSRSERQIDGINNGDWYLSNVDKTHDISIVASYAFSDRLSLSSTFVYGTGQAVTWPNGQYVIDGNVLPYYSNRNEYRMPDYHRLDLNLSYKRPSNKAQWDFSIYNVYNRHNAYSIDFRENPDTGQNQAYLTYLFGIIPSVSYTLNF